MRYKIVWPNVLVLLVLLCVGLGATKLEADTKTEKYYSDKWCTQNKGKLEVTFPDRTRADCVTSTHAVEVEFARKWKEAIGQSLHYAAWTSKRAGIVLIMGPEDVPYYGSLLKIIHGSCLQIDVYTIKREE